MCYAYFGEMTRGFLPFLKLLALHIMRFRVRIQGGQMPPASMVSKITQSLYTFWGSLILTHILVGGV